MSGGALKTRESRYRSGLTQAIDDWCRANDVARKDIQSNYRDMWLVQKRHALMVKLHTEYGLTLSHIGRICKKHHTTVLHVVRKAAAR